MTDHSSLGPSELAAAYRRGATKPVEVVDHCLDRIRRLDTELGALTWVDADGARATAHQLTKEWAAGRSLGPLHGVPIAVKELFNVAGAPAELGAPQHHRRPVLR